MEDWNDFFIVESVQTKMILESSPAYWKRTAGVFWKLW